jgi:hypothetical protein
MMFLPPGMPPPMPQQMPQMPFGISVQMPQQQQINPVNPVNPMAQALMRPATPGQGLTAPGGVIGMPNSNPPFGTPAWMRPMGQ